MTSLPQRLKNAYGAHPAHLVVLAICFAIAGYALVLVSSEPMLLRMAVWFGAAVIVHDLVLFPLYAAADRAASTFLPRSVSALNHVRLPAMASGLLLLIFLPGIIEQGSATYLAATGQVQDGFLVRWLILSGCFFALSAIVYAIRRVRRLTLLHVDSASH